MYRSTPGARRRPPRAPPRSQQSPLVRALAERPVGDYADVDARQLANERRHEGASPDLGQARLVRRADEDVRRATLARDPPHGLDEVVALDFQEMRPKDTREPAQGSQGRRLSVTQLLARLADPERVDLRPEPLRRTEGAPQEALRTRLRGDEREDALGDRLLAEWVEQHRQAARLDVLGELAQDELAEPCQVVDAEEVGERGLDPFARIDLAGDQPLLKRLRRQVDEDDLVGLIEDSVRERLPHAHAGQLEDLVVQALEVLHVDRRGDVDARGEDLVDVLVALAVSSLRHVRMRELVDERKLRLAADDSVHVHLLHIETPVRA